MGLARGVLWGGGGWEGVGGEGLGGRLGGEVGGGRGGGVWGERGGLVKHKGLTNEIKVTPPLSLPFLVAFLFFWSW